MSVILKDTQIFAASPSDWLSQEAAKYWISAQNLTKDQVKIVRNDSCIAVVTKKDIDF